MRLYSGTLKVGDAVWASRRGRRVRVGRLLVVQADRGSDVAQAVAGEIVAVAGWKDAVSGETLSAESDRLQLLSIQAQPAVLSWRVSAEQSSKDPAGPGLASPPRKIRPSTSAPMRKPAKPWSGAWANCIWK